MSALDDILSEWCNGVYYDDALLIGAYKVFLSHLCDAVSWPSDVQLASDFLDLGYARLMHRAHVLRERGAGPYIKLSYEAAKGFLSSGEELNRLGGAAPDVDDDAGECEGSARTRSRLPPAVLAKQKAIAVADANPGLSPGQVVALIAAQEAAEETTAAAAAAAAAASNTAQPPPLHFVQGLYTGEVPAEAADDVVVAAAASPSPPPARAVQSLLSEPPSAAVEAVAGAPPLPPLHLVHVLYTPNEEEEVAEQAALAAEEADEMAVAAAAPPSPPADENVMPGLSASVETSATAATATAASPAVANTATAAALAAPALDPVRPAGGESADGCLAPSPVAAVAAESSALEPSATSATPLLAALPTNLKTATTITTTDSAEESSDDETDAGPPAAAAPLMRNQPDARHQFGGGSSTADTASTPATSSSVTNASPPASTSSSSSSSSSKRSRDSASDVEEGEGEGGPTIRVLDTTERVIKKFKLKCREETYVVENIDANSETLAQQIVDLFDVIIQKQKDAVSAKGDDFCFMEIRSDSQLDKPIYFSKRRCDQLTGNIVLDKMTRILNSNEAFLVSGTLKVSFLHVPAPRLGGSTRYVKHEDLDSWLLKYCRTGTIFNPQNDNDQMCLTRSVAVAIMHKEGNRKELYRFRQATSKLQAKEALRLCTLADIDCDRPSGIEELHRLQRVLSDYRIICFDDNNIKCKIFQGPVSTLEHRRENIYLFWHGGHFYAILKIKAAFGGYSYLCDKCVVMYNDRAKHRCTLECWRCTASTRHDDNEEVGLIRCKDCHRHFRGLECFNAHKVLVKDKINMCDRVKFCSNCKKTYVTDPDGAKKKKKHICNFYICRYCKECVMDNHMCYMREWEVPAASDKTRKIRLYFDIECGQFKPFGGKENVFEHEPNLIISQHMCEKCESDSDLVECDSCGVREHVFQSFSQYDDCDVVEQFLDFLQDLCNEKKTKITLFSHNFKGYDGNFILQGLIKKKITPKLILQGAKIISLSYGSVHFKDSLMFISQKLSSFPKSFGLTELRKGYFCHLANRPEFYEYEGPMPSRDLYCTSGMSSKELVDFNKWYDAQLQMDYVFNFQKEIVEYCRSDVQILREALEIFRKEFIEIGGFDPLTHCITLSAACMKMYRLNHLQPHTIGIVPKGGYRGRDKASFVALKWISWEQSKLGDRATIKTAENGLEVKVMNQKVDGYCELPQDDGSIIKIIYAFQGCIFHNCPHCVKGEKFRAIVRGPNEDPYFKTKEQIATFKQFGYQVVEMWECQFDFLLKHDENVQIFFKNNPFNRVEPLRLRDALMGGRTSSIKTYCKADLSRGEKINLYDICSEYPYINLKAPYVYGHPVIYLGSDPNIPKLKDWNGAAKITVLPPTDLYLPVLGYKCNSKLMFPLCRSCAEFLNEGSCNHTDEERMLTSTWVSPEIKLAIDKNYKIIQVHELYQYAGVKQYRMDTGEEGLFSRYVQTNMALKIEASGWPSDVHTEEQKDEFIRSTLERDGIRLRKDKMVKNSGKRTLAKLVLNSFWGKLGERTLRPTTEIVSNYSQLLDIVANPLVEVSSILPLGEDQVQVRYTPVADMEDSSSTTSVIHAAMTTAFGRMLLYSYLDIVGDRALYHDTDSICYLSRPGMPDPPLGPHLGDLTDQLADDYGVGSFCTEYCSGGPKNYGYKVAVGGDLNNIKTVIKVRGISINSSCDNIITFENLKKMVFDSQASLQVDVPNRIDRVPGWRVVTRSSSKLWRACITKRRRLNDAETVPYGFQGAVLDQDEYALIDDLCDEMGE